MPCFRTSTLIPLALAAAALLTTTPARAHDSRWLAALPFGVGQFQNGDVGLGVFFAAGEALLGATSIATVVAVNHLASTQVDAYTDLTSLNASLKRVTMVNNISFAAWAALTSIGIVEAQMSFGPRHARREKQATALTPIVTPLPGGAFIGVAAAF